MNDYLAVMSQLEKPFAFEDHGFIRKKNGDIESVYILKEAIRRRMSLIDPKWNTGAPELVGIQGDVVVMRGTLILLGATRTAVGTGKITRTRQYDGKRVEIEGYELAREESKAIKAAVSDLLPRLATEWNIGTYLRQMPRTLNKEAKFKQWLAGQMDMWRKRYNTAKETPSSTPATPASEQTAAPTADTPAPQQAPEKSKASAQENWLSSENLSTWAKFIDWMNGKFGYEQDALEHILADRFWMPDGTFQGHRDRMLGAVLAYHCNYKADDILKVGTAKKLSDAVIDAATKTCLPNSIQS